jgi:hypothetical protein
VVSYQHAMRSPLFQRKAEAQAAYKRFVADNKRNAYETQLAYVGKGNVGLSLEALGQFGVALHAILDETSPAHEGFQSWNPALYYFVHGPKEESINPVQMSQAVAEAQRAFNDTFMGGSRDAWTILYQPVSPNRPAPREQVTVTLRFDNRPWWRRWLPF